jgi:hypothetical protein
MKYILICSLLLLGYVSANAQPNNRSGDSWTVGANLCGFRFNNDTIAPVPYRYLNNNPGSGAQVYSYKGFGGSINTVSDSATGRLLLTSYNGIVFDTLGDYLHWDCGGCPLPAAFAVEYPANYTDFVSGAVPICNPAISQYHGIGSWRNSVMLPRGNNKYSTYFFGVSFANFVDRFGTGDSALIWDNLIEVEYDLSLPNPAAVKGPGYGAASKYYVKHDSMRYFRPWGSTQAVRHANGRDWWLLVVGMPERANWYKDSIVYVNDSLYHSAYSTPSILDSLPMINMYDKWFDSLVLYAYHITDSLIKPPVLSRFSGSHFITTTNPVIKPNSNNVSVSFGVNNIYANLKMSDDGTMATGSAGNVGYYLNFDRCSGAFSNVNYFRGPLDSSLLAICNYNSNGIWTPNNSFLYIDDVCLAPNNKFIYVLRSKFLYQYEIGEPDSAKAWTLLINGYNTKAGDSIVEEEYLGMALAPNGKIYLGIKGEGTIEKGLTVINNPNEKGMACNPCVLCTSLVPDPTMDNMVQAQTLPNNPNYRLGPSPCAPLNIVSTEPSQPWSFSPNPSNGSITLMGNYQQAAVVNILNVQGLTIGTFKIDKFSKEQKLDLSSLSSGLYIIQIGTTSKKLIIK